MALRVISAKASHVREVASRMRREDRDEVIRATGRAPIIALASSFRASDECFSVMIDGRPEGMFGVATLNVVGGLAAPWLLATDVITTNRREFLSASIWWRDKLFSRHNTLRNVVDCQNGASIRWLSWMGATFSEPFKIRSYDFMVFEMRRPCAN